LSVVLLAEHEADLLCKHLGIKLNHAPASRRNCVDTSSGRFPHWAPTGVDPTEQRSADFLWGACSGCTHTLLADSGMEILRQADSRYYVPLRRHYARQQNCYDPDAPWRSTLSEIP